ncbi:MAG: hypothetical protein FWC83_02540, partial [Alphaproteobacteria bacterium]|nr:hypothetical protein [Alphaproteobacteria bacterium]
MKKISLLFAFCSLLFIESASAFNTPARSAFLIDPVSHTVIINKEGDTLMPPSSMLKLMTNVMGFDAVRDGRLVLSQRLPVGYNADHRRPVWQPASIVCLEEGTDISVHDILMALIVPSGGDAGVVLAEYLYGSESEMARRMTLRARQIGMPESTFGNVSGLFHPDNLMTSRELSTLIIYIYNNFPEFYPMFRTQTWLLEDPVNDWCTERRRIRANGFGNFLRQMPGAETRRTGRTREGGFGMVAVARRDGRMLVGVINGLDTRNHDLLGSEAQRLLEYGFNNTVNRTFLTAGTELVRIPVWYGRSATIGTTIENDFVVTLRRTQTTGVQIIARYNTPLVAPVRIGDIVGEVIAMQN